MPSFICETCGTGFPLSDKPPERCPICEDPRQYVPPTGQKWTVMDALSRRAMNAWKLVEPGLMGIGSEPKVGIGQRALILATPQGNILWDCITLLDEATIDLVNAIGGLSAIAISHPHYYGTMVDWAQAFDAPIYLHADDSKWVMRPDASIRFWQGETHELADGVTLIRCGGHFAGGAVLHWAGGSEGQGSLLAGDIVQVVPDRTHVSFMRSYPNLLPLSAPAVARIAKALEPYEFETLHGPFFGRSVVNAKDVLRRSVVRYLAAICSDGTPELE